MISKNWFLFSAVACVVVGLVSLGAFIAHSLLFGGTTWMWTLMYGS